MDTKTYSRNQIFLAGACGIAIGFILGVMYPVAFIF